MSEIDAVAGMYNIVDRGRMETADYQVPIEEFIARLENHDLPQEICVVGLGDVLSGDEELRESPVDTMRLKMDYLNGQRPLPPFNSLLTASSRASETPSMSKSVESSTH